MHAAPGHRSVTRMAPRSVLAAGTVSSRAELRARGVHSRRLASTEFTDVFSGYVTRAQAPAPLRVVARELVDKRLPGALLSHTTAAELCGLPLPHHHQYVPGDDLHVTVPSRDRRRAGPQVRVHRSGVLVRAEGEPLPMVDMTTTLCGLATMLTTEEMVLALDHLLGPASAHRQQTREQIWRSVMLSAATTGKERLRRALWRAEPEVPTTDHTRIRLLFRSNGLPDPVTCLSVETTIPGITVMVDYAYPDRRIAILWNDSPDNTGTHHEGRLRESDLLGLGWTVLRLTRADLDDPRGFITLLRVALKSRHGTRGAEMTPASLVIGAGRTSEPVRGPEMRSVLSRPAHLFRPPGMPLVATDSRSPTL